ncbi:MAG: sialate O-acetylesterase [Myxococcota bacterium]
MLMLLHACAPVLTCGPGTHQESTVCLADERPQPDGDTAEPLTFAPEVLDVYLLAGQSNMDGYSLLTGLPPSLRVAQPDVPLFWSERGSFAALAPASSAGAAYTGPEVTFGRTMADAGGAVALVKFGIGATSLYTYWNAAEDDPDNGEGWRLLMATMDAAALELDATGTPWRWAGFVWMQGETDARYAASAAAYEANLTQLVARVREHAKTPALPTVLGLIACGDMCELFDDVRAAQVAVADADPNVIAVETYDLPLGADAIHYDGPSMRVLGERFAQALLGEPLSAPPTAAMAISDYATVEDGDATVGWRFTTDRPIVVTDVGGFAEATFHVAPVYGIWDTTTQALLATGTVPGRFEVATTWRDGFWYAAVEPIALPPGDYTIGLMIWRTDGNAYATGGVGATGAAVTYVEPRRSDEYWLTFPTDIGPATDLSYLGPSFLYRE